MTEAYQEWRQMGGDPSFTVTEADRKYIGERLRFRLVHLTEKIPIHPPGGERYEIPFGGGFVPKWDVIEFNMASVDTALELLFQKVGAPLNPEGEGRVVVGEMEKVTAHELVHVFQRLRFPTVEAYYQEYGRLKRIVVQQVGWERAEYLHPMEKEAYGFVRFYFYHQYGIELPALPVEDPGIPP
ncbi:MAG: hypothetical protein HY538_02460 [Deltaproteobacteria bacterium]|nr:hypothetical protein [Deltaproteobacteria bacterium]